MFQIFYLHGLKAAVAVALYLNSAESSYYISLRKCITKRLYTISD